MPPTVESFVFGSTSGSTFAFFFFLLFSGTVGYLIYALLTHPRFRRQRFRTVGRVSPRKVAILGAVVAIGIFAAIYFTSLDGFYGLEIAGSAVRLQYILPARTRTISLDKIIDVGTIYAHKLEWRLILRTSDGSEYRSTPASLRSVNEALRRLRQLRAP
jgi:uncharacterized membrane protein